MRTQAHRIVDTDPKRGNVVVRVTWRRRRGRVRRAHPVGCEPNVSELRAALSRLVAQRHPREGHTMRVRPRFAGLLMALAVVVAVLSGLAAPVQAGHAIYGYRCYGSELPRCLWIHIDEGRATAWADIRDPGTVHYWVAVSDIRVQIYKGGEWVTVSSSVNGDYDGWDFSDIAKSHSVSCSTYSVRARALFKWMTLGGTVTSEWRDSYGVSSAYCHN